MNAVEDGRVEKTVTRYRLPLVAAVLMALVLVVVLSGLFAIRGLLVRSFGVARHVQAAQTLTYEALQEQIDEESGIRGFADTRDPTFLQPYYVAQQRLTTTFFELRGDLAGLGLGDALRSLDEARRLSAEWKSHVAEPLLRAPGSVQTLQVERIGKQLMDAFRSQISSLQRVLAVREAESEAATSVTITRLLLYGVVSVGVLGVFGIVLALRQARFQHELDREREGRLLAARFGDLHGIADALPQIVWTATPRGEIDFFNRQWREYTGKPGGEPLLNWGEVVHPDDFDGFMESWKQAIVSGTGATVEFRLRRWDGRFRWQRAFARPVYDRDGAVVAWFATATDIDDQKRAFEGLQRDYEQEKHVADTLQQAFLSKSLVQTPELAFHGSYVPAASYAQVGGDWFDAFALPDGRLIFSIGDVAGHGLEAAVAMNRVRQAILAAAVQDSDPASVLENVNTIVLLQETGMVTALCGYIDPATLTVRYASAGHPAPIVQGPDGPADVLPPGGIPLGVSQEAVYASQTLAVVPGSLLVLYTDGILEWKQNPIEGEQELVRAVSYVAKGPQDNAARAIHNAVFKGALPVDDVAIMTVTFHRSTGEPQTTPQAEKRRGILPFRLRSKPKEGDVPAHAFVGVPPH
ncbi:MAG: SpoIIE family protein phosphatase [bacterium]|nr:SpoIIE family protein phosphatase [bacterium]